MQTTDHTASESRPSRVMELIRRAGPWLLFAGLLFWGWRVWDLSHSLPAYDDVLEVLWVLRWWDGLLRSNANAWVYPLAFYPTGWHVATFAQGPAGFLLSMPLYWLGGAALAYNLTSLLTFVIAFIGMRKLALRLVSPFAAILTALLFTFWGFRWFRISGHLSILLATSLLPWMIWTLERWVSSPGKRHGWLLLIGLLWAITILSSWYFLFLGGILLATWLMGLLLAHRTDARGTLMAAVISALVVLSLSMPWLLVFLRESTAANAPAYEISHVSMWDASLNSLPVPSIYHPFVQSLSRWLYRGPVNEAGQANLGLLACLLALVGLPVAWKDRRWWPVLLCAGTGLVLALGLTLKWNGQAIQWPALRPLDAALWRIGHALKPAFFVPEQAPPPFDTAVPMPGLLLSAIVPLWERARVFARYALLGSMGVYLLAGLGFMRVRRAWAQVVLAGLLVFEVMPPVSGQVPFPPPPHPAFDWLKQQGASASAIVDLGSWQPGMLYLTIGGDALWATDYHQQPTVAGASSVWPAHVVFLDKWLGSHSHPFLDPELIPLLRFYGVRFIVLHLTGGEAEEMLEEAKQNGELQDLRCFEPAAEPGPWSYPICTMRVPPASPNFNLVFRDGWSGAEEWGRWGQGTELRAAWVATSLTPQHLSLAVFPYCVPGRKQQLAVEVNGERLADYGWQECETWTGEITVPASVVQVGWNEIVLHTGYALRPVDVTQQENQDSRPLSVGVSKLRVTPEPAEGN